LLCGPKGYKLTIMADDAFKGLSSIVPFRYLKAREIDSLEADSGLRFFEPGEYLIRQGDLVSDEVFVLLSGSVESIDEGRSPPFRLNVIEPGSYFGERSCLFGSPRIFSVRALEGSTCAVIPGPRFLRLLAESRPFAQAFGTKLREGLGLFDAFDRFNAELSRAVGRGHIEIRRLTELYKALEPALHPLASDEARIDWGALAYAMRRLPENVTRTFVFLLTDNLPTVYASPELLFPFVPTEARHRFVYEMMSGKDIVLVRDGLSDLADFVTCLCAFAVEARKIRYRLNHPDLILDISRLEAGATLDRLPFDAEERAELRKLWPGGADDRVRDIVFHRQAYSVDVRKQVNNYNGRLSELWASQVGEAAERLFGARPSDLPESLEVHLVSSNTHSVSNCLNPYFARRKADILAWADSQGLREEALAGGAWADPFDEVYYLSRPYFSAHPEARLELEASEAEFGIVRLPETVTTGIQVQLIDADRVCSGRCSDGTLIINIDYAFGEQAEEIMRNLLLLFGRNVRSINVLGKAGSLVGARGDIIAPTAFIEQSNDAFQPLPGEEPEAIARLEAALPGRSVHAGPLLTVGGTLLQNRAMLQFYRKIWGCVGLEMEGIWYLRAVLEAEELGVLRRDAKRRFLYYVSDLPLQAGSNLSERLSPAEGIPPLYAITREMLGGLFGGDEFPLVRADTEYDAR
jgi:CRP-like cAMP-binding protein